MLIQSRRLRFFAEDKIVRLRRQVLAPLSLNEGQRISGIIQRRELDGPISGTEAAYRFKKGLREAYLSPFPIEVWPDLWSFSIHCEDQTGVASRLYEFFEDRGIRVLASEGTFTVSGDSNRVYFVLDMTAYGNLRDGDSETRRYLRGVRLYSLEEEMQLAFIHFLNIGNNELPDFQLFRINEYRSMWLRFERAKLEDPKPREIRKKGAVAQEVKPPQEAEWEYPRIGYFKSVIRKSNTIPPAVLRQMRSRSGETLAKVRQTQANFYHFPVGLDSTSSKFCWASGDPWAADGYDSFFKDAIWTMSTADPTSRLLRIIFVPDETSEEDAPIARTYSIHFLMAYPIREDDASLARVDTALARAYFHARSRGAFQHLAEGGTVIRYQLRPGKSVYDYQQGLGDPSATEPELARLREWAEKITDEFAADKSQQKRVPHFARLDIIFRTTAPLKREKLKRAIQARADEDQEAEWMKGGKFEVANFYDEDAS